MSTALAEIPVNGYHAATTVERSALSPETMERLVIHGDLSKLTSSQRVEYYLARCHAVGLDPATKPFEYLKLPAGKNGEPGKEILYANKGCTDQLAGLHKLSVKVVERIMDRDAGIYTAQARVRFPDGREVDDIGVVAIAWGKSGDLFTGDALGNAMMKAVTKAKRRSILSACGLGMLDETEIETIPDARHVEASYADEKEVRAALDNHTGHGHGKYVPKDDEGKYNSALKLFLDKVNAKWSDAWQIRNGGKPLDGVKAELLNGYQMNGHLVKWAVETGLLDPNLAADNTSPEEKRRFSAVAYTQHRDETRAEMARYAQEQFANAELAFYRRNPELAEDHAYEFPTAEAAPEDESQEREPDMEG